MKKSEAKAEPGKRNLTTVDTMKQRGQASPAAAVAPTGGRKRQRSEEVQERRKEKKRQRKVGRRVAMEAAEAEGAAAEAEGAAAVESAAVADDAEPSEPSASEVVAEPSSGQTPKLSRRQKKQFHAKLRASGLTLAEARIEAEARAPAEARALAEAQALAEARSAAARSATARSAAARRAAAPASSAAGSSSGGTLRKAAQTDSPGSRATGALASASIPGGGGRARVLVLLDLNGVLVHRSAAGATDFQVRPGTLELISLLAGRVDLGFCSSMRPANARKALKAIGTIAHRSDDSVALAAVRAAPLFAGDDFHFRNDIAVPVMPLRVPSLEPWRMLRNLAHVWSSALARGHSANSTILCDDTPGKCPLSPRNVLLVPTWDGAGLDNAAAAPLKQLGEQLLSAAAAHAECGEGADVRSWLDAV